MKPVAPVDNGFTSFDFEGGAIESTQEIVAQSGKIGWLHAQLDNPDGSFNIVFRDALGREKHRIENCKNPTGRFGVYANIPTLIGEKLSVSLEQVRGLKKVDLFIN